MGAAEGVSAADRRVGSHRVRVSAGGHAQPVTEAPSAVVAAAVAGVTATSAMVALKPRPDEAAALEQLGGHPADTLHVTLVFLGDIEGPLDAVQAALQEVAAAHAPLEGKVAGIAAFAAGDDGAPSLVLPSVPGLVELRVAVTQALVGAGVDYSRTHGYVPHMTIAYDKTGYTFPSLDSIGQELHFDDLLIVRGDTEIIPLPLTGITPLTAAGAPTFCLPSNLRTKTDPVRQAVVESVMKPALEGAGITFDVLNPFTARVLAQSGSQITEISQTTQAEVMRVIKLAHDEGLTIPDTAKAIQAHMAEAAPDRATLIARTELAGAVNGGSLAATQIVSEATGVSYKKTWMTAPGAHFPRHEEYDGLDGQISALDGYFDVGGAKLQFPGDPDGPPEEVCNCRCTMRYADGGIADAESGGEPLQAAGTKTVTAAHHTKVLHAANKRIDDHLEAQLAAVLLPILIEAGDVAAQQFTQHAYEAYLVAAADSPAGWLIPAPEEVLQVSCETPGAATAATATKAVTSAVAEGTIAVQDVASWVADSVVRQPVYHVTKPAVADVLRSEGVDWSKLTSSGPIKGAFYTSDYSDAKAIQNGRQVTVALRFKTPWEGTISDLDVLMKSTGLTGQEFADYMAERYDGAIIHDYHFDDDRIVYAALRPETVRIVQP